MEVVRRATEPIRVGLTWKERWEGPDGGIIACWERGREERALGSEIATRAQGGELVVLPWKGGVERRIKKQKFGTYFYLAMWQGLRGEDLKIDVNRETSVACSVTGVTVIFTADPGKYAEV